MQRLELHVKTLLGARAEDKKRIRELERELSNCSQELGICVLVLDCTHKWLASFVQATLAQIPFGSIEYCQICIFLSVIIMHKSQIISFKVLISIQNTSITTIIEKLLYIL